MRVDELVRVYEKNAGVNANVVVRWIGRSEFDGIFDMGGNLSFRWSPAAPPEFGMPIIIESKHNLRLGSEHLLATLKNIIMTPEQLNAILTAMRRADVRGIGFGGLPDKRFVEVNYPGTGGDFHCTWMFVTPLSAMTIAELAQQGFVTDETEGEEGPYILNDRWLTYKSCVS